MTVTKDELQWPTRLQVRILMVVKRRKTPQTKPQIEKMLEQQYPGIWEHYNPESLHSILQRMQGKGYLTRKVRKLAPVQGPGYAIDKKGRRALEAYKLLHG